MKPVTLPDSLRIFIVEDQEAILRLLTVYLRARGHTVVSACDMGNARRTFPEGKWDLLICDKHLPDGDGWELLLEDPGADASPYRVAMSGAATDRDIELALTEGCYHLPKPFGIEQIDEIVEAATHRRTEHAAAAVGDL
jgi:DNA-binding response OmpR family regulator